MDVLCIWGKDREEVERLYGVAAAIEDAPKRITWRLASAFDGKRVGQVCLAPSFPDIQEAYVKVLGAEEKKAKAKSKEAKSNGRKDT